MNKLLTVLLSAACVVSLCPITAHAGDHNMPKVEHSKEFEKLKGLEGRWEGKMIEQGKEEPVVVEYKLTSGGSALVETMSPGTPHEMVSIYHDVKGKLQMTHYCMLGNQPILAVTSSTPSLIKLDFAGPDSIDPKTEDHMHSLEISFTDDKAIEQRWSGYSGGQVKGPTVFKLSRVKDS